MATGFETLPVGHDALKAELIAEAARTQGLRIRLMRGDETDDGVPDENGEPYKIVCRASDLAAIEELVEDHQ